MGSLFLCLFLVSQSLSCVLLCDPLDCSTSGFPVLHYLPEFAQTNIHWVNDAIQPSHPLSPPSLLALNLSNIRVFSKWSTLCIRWPKYWSFSFSISPSNEYSGLISFKFDWFDLLTVQGTLKNLLQHYISKASILRCTAFFMVQLTSIHDYWKYHSFDYMDFCVSYFRTKIFSQKTTSVLCQLWFARNSFHCSSKARYLQREWERDHY